MRPLGLPRTVNTSNSSFLTTFLCTRALQSRPLTHDLMKNCFEAFDYKARVVPCVRRPPCVQRRMLELHSIFNHHIGRCRWCRSHISGTEHSSGASSSARSAVAARLFHRLVLQTTPGLIGATHDPSRPLRFRSTSQRATSTKRATWMRGRPMRSTWQFVSG